MDRPLDEPETVPLVLIEPYAFRLGGHHQRTLLALARAVPGTVVIAPHGIARPTATTLRRAPVTVVAGATVVRARLLLRAAGPLSRQSWAGQKLLRMGRWPDAVRRWPHQITLLARCLVEASALRTARHRAPGTRAGAVTVVVLSASEGLRGTAALLGAGASAVRPRGRHHRGPAAAASGTARPER
ncbi:hypothetical protein AB0O01_21125 [Streptomyces sp. NPDC093252]|uniref:hypothetical protein n=1 Tax=Streptomyces sp. NPDC093252 TaxID=3154980 RepID=UPI00343FFECC